MKLARATRKPADKKTQWTIDNRQKGKYTVVGSEQEHAASSTDTVTNTRTTRASSEPHQNGTFQMTTTTHTLTG